MALDGNYNGVLPAGSSIGDWWSKVATASPLYAPDEEANRHRLRRMALGWQAYFGQLPPSLKTKARQPNDNVYVNMARVAVDESAAFLFGESVQFDLDGTEDRSEDEKYLDAIWERCEGGKDAFLYKLAVNGSVCGTPFVKIVVDAEGPRLVILDPMTVTVQTANDDRTVVLVYCISWCGYDPKSKKKMDYRQLIERVPAEDIKDLAGVVVRTMPQVWKIVDQERESVPDQRFGESKWKEVRRDVWEWPFPPIIHCQNLPSPNDFWGLADLEPDVVALNEAINKVASNTNRIIRIHAHPKTYSQGLSTEQQTQIAINPDGMMHLPEGSDLKTVEMQSDLASSFNFYRGLQEAFYQTSRTPEIASGKVADLGYLSGIGMQILYGPGIKKNRLKQKTYGGLVNNTNKALLQLGQRAPRPTKLTWPQVLPRDEQVESQSAMNWKQVGASTDTLLDRGGFDPTMERERRKADLAEEVTKTKELGEAEPKPAPGATPAKPGAPPARQTGGSY